MLQCYCTKFTNLPNSSIELVCTKPGCSVSTLIYGTREEHVPLTEWLSPTIQALSTDWDKHLHKWWCTCAQVPICYHIHYELCVLYVHTLTLTQTNTQPEAEDLRLRSGTWSQSHLGPQILLCSLQSGLILCSTESCSPLPCLPYLTYKCAAEFMWLTSVSFSRTKRFPGIRCAWIRLPCISEWLWRKFWEAGRMEEQ